VGNLDLEGIKPMVIRYLASLPSLNRQESWKDLGVRPPKGVIKKRVEKGIEPQSQVAIVFTGPFDITPANRNAMRAMGLVLQTRLRNTIREELGGTYSISASPSFDRIPEPAYSFSISFGTDPERVEELGSVIFEEIDKLKNDGASEEELRDAKQAMFRDYETGIKQNRNLLAQLQYRYMAGEDLESLFDFQELLEQVTLGAIDGAARSYLDTENYVQVILIPEK
jgi:zinc protease